MLLNRKCGNKLTLTGLLVVASAANLLVANSYAQVNKNKAALGSNEKAVQGRWGDITDPTHETRAPASPREIKRVSQARGSKKRTTILPINPELDNDQIAGRELSKGFGLESSVFQFPNRRSGVDPFRVGEKMKFEITYFGVKAGDFSLEILPFKQLNHRKVYHIKGTARSSPVFSLFYKINDTLQSFMDYEGLFSHRFHVQLDESKQTRDALELYDSEMLQAFYWNRWNRKESGYTEAKDFFPIERFPQDSLSAIYYLRTMALPDGASLSFPVASEGKSWESVIKVVRREVIDSPLGKVKTVVVKPETRYQGIVQKKGDTYLWLTDDDRRFIVKLQAQVKVGTILAQLKEIDPGTAGEIVLTK